MASGRPQRALRNRGCLTAATTVSKFKLCHALLLVRLGWRDDESRQTWSVVLLIAVIALFGLVPTTGTASTGAGSRASVIIMFDRGVTSDFRNSTVYWVGGKRVSMASQRLRNA